MTFSSRSILHLTLLSLAACDPIIIGDLEPQTTGEGAEGDGSGEPADGGEDPGDDAPTPDAGESGDPSGDPGDDAPTPDVGGGGDPSDGDPSDGDPSDGDPTGAGTFDCDLYIQDCIDGEKCMPWDATGGDTWNATRCAPADSESAAIGDACVVEGGATSGTDNCAAGTMCFHVDPETNEGVCVAMCPEVPEDIVCTAPTTVCSVVVDGLLNVCVEP